MTRQIHRAALLVAVVVVAALITQSCFDNTGPALVTGQFALAPRFESAAAGIVTIAKFRVVLRRTADNGVALDTVIAVPAGADSVGLGLTVRMLTSSDAFSLTLALITSAGDTAFRAGPTIVKPDASGGAPAPVALDLRYTGVGANALGVRIVTANPQVFFADTTTLAAEAFDSTGAAIRGTPIAWASLDTLKARIPTAAAGRVLGGAQRGQARITATLLTGPADTAGVLVQPVPVRAVVESGDSQLSLITTTLPQAVQVRVTAADSLGVAGVAVHFQVNAGGGTLDLDSGLTDDSGRVTVHWTLGTIAGPQTASAHISAAIPDSVLPLVATALAAPPDSLAINGGDGQTGAAGLALATAPSVIVRDSLGNAVPGATVTFQVTAGGGSLTAATATTDSTGVAHVGSWTLGTLVGANALRAFVLRGPGDTLSVSFSATGVAGAAASLVFASQPTNTTVNAAIAPFQVTALDAFNNLASGFSSPVTVTFQTNPAGGSLGGTVSVTATSGIATFSGVSITAVGSRYALQASTGGVTPATSQQFLITPVGMTHLWTGATSTDWSVGTNWDVLSPPSLATDVVFVPGSAANQPTSSTAGTVGSLYVEGDATLTLGTGVTLTVAGNIVGGSIVGPGTVLMSGTADVSVTGRVPNLEIGVAATARALVADSVHVLGNLSLTRGTLALNGYSATVDSALNFNATGSDTASLNFGALDGKSAVVRVGGGLSGSGYMFISMHESLDTLDIGGSAALYGQVPSDTALADGAVVFRSEVDEDGGLQTEPGLYPDSLGNNTIVMAGSGGHTMGLAYTQPRNLRIVGDTVRMGYSGTIIRGNLTIAGTGIFDGSSSDTVMGQLLTQDNGRLLMNNSGDMTVQGDAVFGGGDETGMLTSGSLFLAGNFSQTTSATAFVADSGFAVSFAGGAPQNVTFTDPGTSHFGDLRLAQPGAAAPAPGVTLLSPVAAVGGLQVPGDTIGGQTVVGNGNTLTVGGLNVSGLTLDHAPFTWDGTGLFSGVFTRINNTTFKNFLDSEIQFYIRNPGTGSQISMGGNLTFLSNANPANGGSYMKAEDTDGTLPYLSISTFFFTPSQLPNEPQGLPNCQGTATLAKFLTASLTGPTYPATILYACS